jgi:AcrR family transcriptional regulator
VEGTGSGDPTEGNRRLVSRRQPRGQETRERILAVALSQFSSRGYHAVSVEDIASAAGVTKGAVYYWFTDKDDIGRDLQHELYERLTREGLAALDPDADTVTSIRRALEVFLNTLDNLGEAQFFLRDAWTIPELGAGTVAVGQDAVALLRGVLTGGMARGEIVALDPDAMARVLFGALTEATMYVLTTGKRGATLAVVDHLVESLGTGERAAGLTPTVTKGRGD